MNATYSKWERPKKLGVEELDSIWLATIQELYGKEGEIFTYENMSHLWSYVSHFHRPFYVYSYAFGELLTHSLYAQQENLGEKFEPLYIEMLESGSTKNAIELLAPFELDPTREDFWNNGLEISLGKLITEAEELSKELSI
jgi:oligoendopeptidase F